MKGRVGNPYAEYPTNATGDPYKPAAVAGLRTLDKQSFEKGGHEKDFFPAKTVTHKKAQHASSHEYLPHCTGSRNKKNFRTEDGDVIIEPRNFYTSNPKKGKVQRRDTERVEFGGVNAYSESDFNMQK